MGNKFTKTNGTTASDFQTPPPVANYMACMVPLTAKEIAEPTPGDGNLLKALIRESMGRKANWAIHAPDDYFEARAMLQTAKLDCVVMNPPFSAKSTFNIPPELEEGMKVGYKILHECMDMAPSVIALMPWFTILDSDVRLRRLMAYGLISVTALPRKTFSYSRIQTCVFELRHGYKGETLFKQFNF